MGWMDQWMDEWMDGWMDGGFALDVDSLWMGSELCPSDITFFLFFFFFFLQH